MTPDDEGRSSRADDRDQRADDRDQRADRRDTRDDARDSRMEVVSAVVDSLNQVISSLRSEIRMLGATEQRGRKNTYTAMAVVGFLIILSLVQMRANYDQGRDIKRLVSYIEDCQNPDGECARRNADKLGGAVRAVSASVFDSLTDCVLITPPEDRTEDRIAECRDRHFPR